MKRFILILFALIAVRVANAQPGLLDVSFAQQGSYIFRPDTETVCYESIVDEEGRIVMAGWMQMPESSDRYPLLVRLLENGSPDASFGTGGYIDASQMNLPGNLPYFGTIAQQSNGKYIALGYDNYDGHQLYRFNEDGGLDNSFSSTPFMLHRAGLYSSVVDSQDRTIVSCFYFPDDNIYQYYGNVAVLRFAADGALDLSFGTGGMVMLGNLENDERCYDVAADLSDNVYVSGYWSPSPGGGTSAARVYGFDTAGQLRSDFGADGVVEINVGSGVYNGFTGVTVAANGDVLACGNRYNTQTFIQQGMIMRCSPNGQPISNFSSNGIHLSNDSDAEYKRIVELADGMIAVAARVKNPGFEYDARISMVDANGQIASAFGNLGNSALFDVGSGDETPLDILADDQGRLIMAGYGFAVFENPALGIQYGSKGFVNRYYYGAPTSVNHMNPVGCDIYPNPAHDMVFCAGVFSEPFTIFNSSGQIVHAGIYSSSGINVSALSEGIYILQLKQKKAHFIVNK